ncbi:MAG: ribbon-helix-helix domain-containing protein [Bifidobacteriaceae bacterium]|nr:ribbon-helix-helix domain-containing protein [Bifidobacteriaceae bacterium]
MAMTLRLPERLEEGLRAVSRRSGRPRSEIIAQAVERFLDASTPLPRVSTTSYAPVPERLRITTSGASADELLKDLREDRF